MLDAFDHKPIFLNCKLNFKFSNTIFQPFGSTGQSLGLQGPDLACGSLIE